MTSVLGVDACPAGWCGVSIEVRASGVHPLPPRIFRSFAEALETDAHIIAVDIPIGLLDRPGSRGCDLEARRLLGRPAASSVYPAPSRAACGIADYREASALNAQVTGRRLSRQSFNIAARVCEVDRLMTPPLQARVVEAHPELAFWALNGCRPLSAPKRRLAGRLERWALLRQVLPELPESPPAARDLPAGCKPDDYVDALAVAWTALCILRGRARRVPVEPETDDRGLRMEIWFPG